MTMKDLSLTVTLSAQEILDLSASLYAMNAELRKELERTTRHGRDNQPLRDRMNGRHRELCEKFEALCLEIIRKEQP